MGRMKSAVGSTKMGLVSGVNDGRQDGCSNTLTQVACAKGGKNKKAVWTRVMVHTAWRRRKRVSAYRVSAKNPCIWTRRQAAVACRAAGKWTSRLAWRRRKRDRTAWGSAGCPTIQPAGGARPNSSIQRQLRKSGGPLAPRIPLFTCHDRW